MKLNRYQRAELGGLILLFASLGWEVLWSSPIADLATEARAYVINRKLDILWDYLGAVGYEVRKDEPIRWTTDYGQFDESWRRLSVETKNVEDQEAFADAVKKSLYVGV